MKRPLFAFRWIDHTLPLRFSDDYQTLHVKCFEMLTFKLEVTMFHD